MYCCADLRACCNRACTLCPTRPRPHLCGFKCEGGNGKLTMGCEVCVQSEEERLLSAQLQAALQPAVLLDSFPKVRLHCLRSKLSNMLFPAQG